MKSLVVIPTYNEIQNIPVLVKEIRSLIPNLDLLIVDDSSPDGTAKLVSEMSKSDPHLHLLLRQKKEGLGRAYLAGFAWGLEKKFEAIVEMDADFSHRPEDLVRILAALPHSDFIVGSRYVSGGSTVNWGLGRKIISRGGGIYARLILGFPLRDWTGGFNAWTRSTLEKINLAEVKSNGYSFQIELKYRAQLAGCKGLEVPIVFEDRRVGQSKMSMKIVIEAFYRVWLMRLHI